MEAEDFASKVKDLQSQKGCYTVKESKRKIKGKEYTVKEHVRCDGYGSTVVSVEPVESEKVVIDDPSKLSAKEIQELGSIDNVSISVLKARQLDAAIKNGVTFDEAKAIIESEDAERQKRIDAIPAPKIPSQDPPKDRSNPDREMVINDEELSRWFETLDESTTITDDSNFGYSTPSIEDSGQFIEQIDGADQMYIHSIQGNGEFREAGGMEMHLFDHGTANMAECVTAEQLDVLTRLRRRC